MYVLREQLGDDKTMPDVDWTSYFHSSTALNLASLNYAEEYAQLVVKEGNLEANWQAWFSEKMPIITAGTRRTERKSRQIAIC